MNVLYRLRLTLSFLVAAALGDAAIAQCRNVVRYHYSRPVGPAPITEYVSDAKRDFEAAPEAPWSDDEEDEAESATQWHFGKTVEVPRLQEVRVNSSWKADCGQSVIASILAAIGKKMDDATYDKIGLAVNAGQDGVSAAELTSYLHPYVKSTFRRASFADLKEHVDRGLPAILAVQTSRVSHWVLVAGYTTNGRGDFKYWKVVDNGAVGGQRTHEELKRMWEPLNNYCLLVEPKGEYPRQLNQLLVDRSLDQEPKRPSPRQPLSRNQYDDSVEKSSEEKASTIEQNDVSASKVTSSELNARVISEASTTEFDVAKSPSSRERSSDSVSRILERVPPGSPQRILLAVGTIACSLCLVTHLAGRWG